MDIWCEMRWGKEMTYAEKLHKAQFKFFELFPLLILFLLSKGYTGQWGSARARDGHKKDSLHYDSLAVDINLFKDGRYLTKTEDHKELGEFWESLHPDCVWGGRFDDGNHYSFKFNGRM